MSQRGGAVQSHLRISDRNIDSDLIPEGECDMILSVEPMEALRYLPFLSPDGWLVTSGTPFRNNDQYRFRGVELTVRTRPLEALDVLASYSFLDSENRSSGTDQNGLQNRPEHRATFEARYRLPYGFALRGALYYVADQVVYSRQEPVRQRGTGDYFLAELRIAKTLLEERAWLYFGVDNLADANYQESYGVPGPGRVFYGGLEGRF